MVCYRALHGMCVGYEELRSMLRVAAETVGTRPLTDDFPNDKFTQCWLAKHPDLPARTAQLLDVDRASASTADVVLHYFNNLQSVMKTLDIFDKPNRIWNCDETGICPQGRGRVRVIRPKGLRANVQRSADRENVSIMACVNAAGERMPPLYIFKGVRRKHQWTAKAKKTARCAASYISNINGKWFLYWVKWFVSLLPPERPQLLVLDGHLAHIQLDVVKYGTENVVHLFALPAHTSHFLQPLDVAVLGVFKTLYESAVKRFSIQHDGKMPIRDDTAGIASAPLIEACCAENATKGFKDAGLYPLSLDVMMKKIIGNKPTVRHDELPHLSIILSQKAPLSNLLQVTERQKRVLRELDLNVDALNVVSLLSSTMVAPQAQKRKRGDWVNENYSGGQLLSYDMMDNAASAKTAPIAKRKANNESAPKEKRARDAMNLHDKAGHQTERSKKTLEKWERAGVRREQKAERAAAQRAKAQRITAQCEQRLNRQEVVERAADGCTLWVDV
ncbi:hypothetical protein PF005_g19301 [Phytophthora fragariae]|uniref:DDE-1 domain-containing protein n=2 Tax=Phytophthora fragariae TaxID=53985 RepID=A0A6A3E723_9STRA|nr:hypothetical protein PF003_g39494 [Phytophthora fragariae]KAE8929659.1 hypothetical protein PF009_g20230 [Phytophthora fragariae]KAE9190306.1 hypothetical protein PF005_g19301 [Phytophthora fragariae]KAE9247230.1 hypothetical protein PF002_g6382 [Phytophthora fragariae]KAE9307179.1 hypothetical protein PF001_g11745 [Phytophthora fragariae]